MGAVLFSFARTTEIFFSHEKFYAGGVYAWNPLFAAWLMQNRCVLWVCSLEKVTESMSLRDAFISMRAAHTHIIAPNLIKLTHFRQWYPQFKAEWSKDKKAAATTTKKVQCHPNTEQLNIKRCLQRAYHRPSFLPNLRSFCRSEKQLQFLAAEGIF